MDELKTRLEFLEHVTSTSTYNTNDEDLLQQIDNLGASLHELVDKRSEMHGKAQELANKSALERVAAQLPTHDPSDHVSSSVEAEVINAKLDETTKFIDQLEANPDLSIPALRPTQSEALADKSVFTQFDKASVQSVQVSQRWMNHVATTNGKTADTYESPHEKIDGKSSET